MGDMAPKGNLEDTKQPLMTATTTSNTRAARRWDWQEDELTQGIVGRVRQGEAAETRQFLRPIFRWMKIGVHKDGKRDEEAIEKAFAFVDWLVLLSTEGDTELGIARMPDLQPSYALNTIVTASQRAGSLQEATRAFDLILQYGYDPDVFTYTALIDITARSGDVPGAIKIYEQMRMSSSRPNIVTYTTLIRSTGFNESVQPEQCLVFLSHAREDDTFDDSLFLEAITVCAHRKDLVTAQAVLSKISVESPALRSDERFYHAIAQLTAQFDDDQAIILESWTREAVISNEELDRILAAVEALQAAAVNGSKALGCLGYQTSQSVRKAVVQHDIVRLIGRIQSGVLVTVWVLMSNIRYYLLRSSAGVSLTYDMTYELLFDVLRSNDFETLIHQCRKRKWKDDVAVILDAMRDVAKNGWNGMAACNGVEKIESSTDATNVPSGVLPPQPHLAPTARTFVAVIDAYLTCGDEPLAWEVVESIAKMPGLEREFALYRKFVRGSYLLTNCDHISELLRLASQDGIIFSNRMCVEIARMFGHRHQEGITILLNQLPNLIEPSARSKMQLYLEELVKSCAYKRNVVGVEETLRSMIAAGYQRSANTETAIFVSCIHQETFEEASATLRHFQRAGVLLQIPVYDSLLREIFFKYTRRGHVFDDSSRKVALKTLYVRRSLFTQAFADRKQLEDSSSNDYVIDPAGSGSFGAGDRDWAALSYWCRRNQLTCSPLMFAQHTVEILTTIRDKESKFGAEREIRTALLTANDPLLFLLRTVTSLRFLDLTYRALGKLAKQLLALVTAELPVEARHIEYCVAQLPLLTVHIVKELDDVVQMHQSHSPELLAFALEALERDNVDKVVGFLVHRPELYTLETAKLVTPKLADLYVYGHVNTVVQFYKPEVPESLDMQRLFVREVIELESLDVPEDEDDGDVQEQTVTFPSSSRAIKEFKLEHEPEFMPFVLHSLRSRSRSHLSTSADDDGEQDGVKFLKIPLDDDRVIVVDNDDAVSLAYDVLRQDDVRALGLDAEWRPDFGSMQSKCSVLQVACSTHVFLFDLVNTSMGDLEDLFAGLFASDRIAKLGFGLDGDIKRLRWSFPETNCFDVFENVVDLSFEVAAVVPCHDGQYVREQHVGTSGVTRHSRRPKGLSAYVKEVLGLPLRKTQQRSDWERRPLSTAQISYAALDAYCLLMLHEKVQE